MNSILTVKNLCKSYPSFRLDNVSFSLEEGKITGFIGRNGAGKTTTLHSLLSFVHPDSGSIRFWDREYDEHELEIKQRLGFVSAGMSFYAKKKLRQITDVTRPFYHAWNEEAYRKYLSLFSLEEEKTPDALSNGMKIKYMLALALSHGAELLILDEPTSGLDPLSREELLEIFLELANQGKTILFSTHITSDLEKTADNILYLSRGRLLADDSLSGFLAAYRLCEYTEGQVPREWEGRLIGPGRTKNGFSALLQASERKDFPLPCRQPSLEEIMIHFEKED